VSTLIDDQRRTGKTTDQLNESGRRELLEVIDEESDRLDRFIEDLMALARIEAGELQLRREWGSLEEIFAAAVKRAAPLLRRHKVELALADGLPSVRVDERAVAEVIYVLLENSAKYSPPESIIRLSANEGDHGMVELMIEDQGPGIPPELRERVFEKFFRAPAGGDSGVRKPGSGMGLAVAKGIVEAHGGRIWIEDGPDAHGTKVRVLLPTGDVSNNHDNPLEAPQVSAPARITVPSDGR
ncbi:MAG TPA: ATP-binding protein, partial [Pyrinomonadaceae bacterium]|nr:ATP-binding protein [Pyrinomonadaceae bacterium]